jgi:hypothetical protein
LAESPSNPLQTPLPDGIVPEEVVARTEKRWFMVMAVMLGVMMAIGRHRDCWRVAPVQQCRGH